MIKILVDGVEFEQGEEVEAYDTDCGRVKKGVLTDIRFTKEIYKFCVKGIYHLHIRKLPKTRELTHAEIFKHVAGKCVFKLQDVKNYTSHWKTCWNIKTRTACIIKDLDTEREAWHGLDAELLVKLGVAL